MNPSEERCLCAYRGARRKLITLSAFYRNLDTPAYYRIIKGVVTDSDSGKEFVVVDHPAFIFQRLDAKGRVRTVLNYKAGQLNGTRFHKSRKTKPPKHYRFFLYGKGEVPRK